MNRINHTTQDQHAFGVRIEQMFEQIEALAAGSAVRSTALGAGLGLVAVAGGIGAFLLVWYVLVDVLT
jgi:hypothetical protein